MQSEVIETLPPASNNNSDANSNEDSDAFEQKDDQIKENDSHEGAEEEQTETENESDDEKNTEPLDNVDSPSGKVDRSIDQVDDDDGDDDEDNWNNLEPDIDPKIKERQEFIKNSTPSTELEVALSDELNRKTTYIKRLSGEIVKLKAFISKRKQTYKRKRKDGSAPTRPLSAYNIFVQDRFIRLAKENEAALKCDDSDIMLKRVPPASLVASTGNEWKDLPAEVKAQYQQRAKADRKRYEDEMSKYEAPDKITSRKRNKTGYNMFFTAHVQRLKHTDTGVPSERGSVARIVGNAWKELSQEEKQYYDNEADKHNSMNGEDDDDESVNEEESKPPANPGLVVGVVTPNMPPQMGHVPVVHHPGAVHYAPTTHYPYSYYEYPPQQRHHHGHPPPHPASTSGPHPGHHAHAAYPYPPPPYSYPYHDPNRR